MRIVIADDDAGVLAALEALLGSSGEHELRTAAAGGQALQGAMAMGGVDLLISDVVMEPMDGFKLRDLLAARYPDARTIFITGYDLSDHAEQTANHQVLMKPIEADELWAAIYREFGWDQENATEAAVEAEAAPEFIEPEPPAEAPVAVPVARAVAAKVQAPTAVAPAVPRVAATSRAPGAAPIVRAAAAPAAVAAAVSPASSEDDGTALLGHTIGAYQVLSFIGKGRWGSVYAAVQTAINRPVGLKLLDPQSSSDPTAKTRFLGDARAKAHVQHPAILAVYEAGEADGHTFYTHEYVDGKNLDEVQRSGERLDEPTALKVLKATAEALNYLHVSRIAHSPPRPASIYVGVDGHPRLANIATQLSDGQVSMDQEIQIVSRAVLSVLPAIQTVSPGFRTLLSRMVQTSPATPNSWAGLVQEIKALEPKVIPIEAAKISAQDRAAIAAVEAARKAQKRSLYFNIAALIALVAAAVIGVLWMLNRHTARRLDEQVRIPGGPFIFGANQQADLPDFWIDKYEVSIAQYGQFVQFLEKHPTSEYDHERQPRMKTSQMHKPKDWAIYYGRAAHGSAIHSVPSDLNMPALMVDWWDAYAYAKWKGRQLPTEQEWEKAARGTRGFLYPWGDEFDAKNVNSNADFVMQDPGAPGKIDGFNYWGPVDRQRDKSPFGVIGMAGNVAEWTATWTEDMRFPILKGGSYMSGSIRLDERMDHIPPVTAQENIGFRTVSHTAPTK